MQSEELSPSFGGRGTSLLLVQKRSTQEKTTPRLALAGHPARQVREPGPGFSTAHPCAGEKASASLPMPAARPVVPDSPPHRGPGRAAGHRGPHFSEEPEQSGSSARALPYLFNLLRPAVSVPQFPVSGRIGRLPHIAQPGSRPNRQVLGLETRGQSARHLVIHRDAVRWVGDGYD